LLPSEAVWLGPCVLAVNSPQSRFAILDYAFWTAQHYSPLITWNLAKPVVSNHGTANKTGSRCYTIDQCRRSWMTVNGNRTSFSIAGWTMYEATAQDVFSPTIPAGRCWEQLQPSWSVGAASSAGCGKASSRFNQNNVVNLIV
jgi:hypothetical protein